MPKPKNKSAICYLSMGIFPREVLFTYMMTPKQIKAWLQRRGYEYSQKMIEMNEYRFEDERALAHAETVYLKDGEKRVLWVHIPRKFQERPVDYFELNHEMNHIALFGLRDILDVTLEHEAFAYTVSYLESQAYFVMTGKDAGIY